MSTDITVHNQGSAMGSFDQSDEALVRYLGLNPNSPQDRAAVAVCRQYGFDPILKHVVVIPKGGVYITRDGLLNVAHRSGQLDGIVVEQHPTLDKDSGEWVATVSVYRKDMRFPFTFPGRYPANGGNRQYAPEMALKCAEAHALRRAFDVTGLPTLDEQKPTTLESTAPRASAADFTQRRRYDQCDETCTIDCGHCKGAGKPVDAEVVEEHAEQERADTQPAEAMTGGDDFPAQQNRLNAMFAEFGRRDDLAGRDARLAYCTNLLGREVASSKDLKAGDVERVINALKVDAAERDAGAAPVEPGLFEEGRA